FARRPPLSRPVSKGGRSQSGRASRPPPGSSDEESLKKVEVVNRQQAPVGHLQRLRITDIHVEKILADLHLLIDLPGLAIVCTEGDANPARVPMSSGTIAVGAQQPAILQLNEIGRMANHGGGLGLCPTLPI